MQHPRADLPWQPESTHSEDHDAVLDEKRCPFGEGEAVQDEEPEPEPDFGPPIDGNGKR